MATLLNTAGDGHLFKFTSILSKNVLAQLMIKAMLMRLVTFYQDDSGNAMTGKAGYPLGNGDEVHVRLPVNMKPGRGHNINTTTNPNARVNRLVERTAPIRVKDPFHVVIEKLTRVDLTLNFTDERLDYFVNTIGNTLAMAQDKAMMKDLIINVGQFVGSKDLGITLNHFSAGRALMNKVPCPMDETYTCMIDPDTEHNLRAPLTGPNIGNSSSGSGAQYLESIGALSLRNAYIDEWLNMMFYTYQLIPLYNPGTYAGTMRVKGANQTGNTLTVDGLTSAGDLDLKAGMLFTISGMNRIDLHDGHVIGPATFSLTEDVSGSAGDTAATEYELKISPSITVGTAVGSASIDNYNNFDQAPDDNSACTILGDSATDYDQAIMFHKRVMQFADVDMASLGVDPDWDKAFYRRYGVDGGIKMSMRCMLDQEFEEPQVRMRVDSWPAWDVVEEYMACRVIGKRRSSLKAEVPA